MIDYSPLLTFFPFPAKCKQPKAVQCSAYLDVLVVSYLNSSILPYQRTLLKEQILQIKECELRVTQ